MDLAELDELRQLSSDTIFSKPLFPWLLPSLFSSSGIEPVKPPIPVCSSGHELFCTSFAVLSTIGNLLRVWRTCCKTARGCQWAMIELEIGRVICSPVRLISTSMIAFFWIDSIPWHIPRRNEEGDDASLALFENKHRFITSRRVQRCHVACPKLLVTEKQ